ncbi:type II secretion system F family protein [Sulfitobacter sabulilitoris]|uniref:Type II secretion system protein GspF domain-containing protein n=1 Tax=Sulfitobacter sabulilitoris TaxID=2562655 RepID=A0A5S3PJV3_9RHOB|nr:type II secretion system F family protein [Sulfitobacter sabulilitoris]TMM54627.1 hypothetical protein FDT80_03285 [Sulfitobacter sabulilitoris]
MDTTLSQDLDGMFWLAVAGCCVLALLALTLVLSPRNREDRQRIARMQALGSAEPSADKAKLQELVHRRQSHHWSDRIPYVGGLNTRLMQAGLYLSPTMVLLGCAVLTLVLAAPALVLAGLPGLAGAVAMGFGLPLMIIDARRKKRVETFANQLPDALDLMQRGLRVGHPVSVTIGSVGKTMPDPIGQEFRMLSDQITAGDYLTDAFNDLANRMKQEDMDYLSVSISIQHGTGGNLADMLGVLSKVIRDRIMMRRRVKAISSEGRISALLLSALPVGIYVTTSFTAPDYYGGVSDDPLFRPIAVIIVLLVVGNALALRKLVNFKI